MLRLETAHFTNFRCFADLQIALEPDLTVLFAENAGGKTALLTGLAMGLGLLQPDRPSALRLDPVRDTRRTGPIGERKEPGGQCELAWTATVGDHPGISWTASASPTSGMRKLRRKKVSAAIEAVWSPGKRWPLIAYYGTDRLAPANGFWFLPDPAKGPTKSSADPHHRWQGYTDCLDPSASDSPLLNWLRNETFGDLSRTERGKAKRHLSRAVFDAFMHATPGVEEAYYDPALGGPIIRFQSGEETPWTELSDGYHVFLGLVGDIARRAAILNEKDGAEAPQKAEGVVLIDEIDLHLHPRWQRRVLAGLRDAFPKLQFIVTTHSPQVLSSAQNRQVRRLSNHAVVEGDIHVEGRDTNSILREEMDTDERDPRGVQALRALYDALDRGKTAEAKSQLATLLDKWGTLDPDLIRAQSFIDEEDE